MLLEVQRLSMCALGGDKACARAQGAETPSRTQHPSPRGAALNVQASSSWQEDDGGTLRIKDLDTGWEMQVKQARAGAS